MPTISAAGVTVAYEVWGQGKPVVFTPGGWFPRHDYVYLMAGRLSAHNQVLMWDRRNSGASEIKIEDAPNECHLWADDLHHLLNALNMSPAYLAGSSYGSIFSLYMAHRYPQDVMGLILLDIATDDLAIIRSLNDAHYFRLGEIAERKGMEAVIAYSTEVWYRVISGTSKPADFDDFATWVAECIQKNPSNRARLLSTDPKAFAAAMRKWGEWNCLPRHYLANLTDDELAHITTPTLVIPGLDPVHPEHTAKEVAGLLPNAQLTNYSERYTQAEIQRVQESDVFWKQHAFAYLPFIEEFLQTQA